MESVKFNLKQSYTIIHKYFKYVSNIHYYSSKITKSLKKNFFYIIETKVDLYIL